MTHVQGAPPADDSVGPITRTIEVVCLASSAILLVINGFRLG